MKVKLFHSQGLTSKKKIDGEKLITHQALESEMNVWLEENPTIKVSQIHQTQSGGSLESSSVTITIWYE